MSKIKKNKFGFKELKKPPSKIFLDDYYKNFYYQNNRAFYKSKYEQLEKKYIESKIKLNYENIVSFQKKNFKGTLLDIGCGQGDLLSYFKNMGWNVTGIDKSIFASNKKNSLKKKIIYGDIEECLIKLHDSKFKYDVICMNNVLEHLLNPEIIIHMISNLMKKSSILSITIPNDDSLFQNFLKKNLHINKDHWIAFPDHINYFNHKSFKSFMLSQKLKLIDSVADFPIEIFLLNKNSNYVNRSKLGKQSNSARLQFEKFLVSTLTSYEINDFYRSLAKIGMGRNINYLCKKK